MKINFGKTIKINLALTAFLLGSSLFVIASTASPSYARERECFGKFTINRQTTGLIFLGEVGGFLRNKKKLCREKAKEYATNNLRPENFEGINFDEIKQTVCLEEKLGGVEVSFDTQVEGKINSRDGSIRSLLNVACENQPSN